MSGSLCFWNLCVRKFCRAYISVNHIFKEREVLMNEVMLVMTGKTFAKMELAAFAVGAVVVGGLTWVCNRWDKAYKDARSSGVVA